MVRKFANFLGSDCTKPITKETHGEFLFHLEGAVLLALRESGSISMMEYRYASENLRRQQAGKKRLSDD